MRVGGEKKIWYEFNYEKNNTVLLTFLVTDALSSEFEITDFTVSIVNSVSVTVAFEDINHRATVTCILKNNQGKVLAKKGKCMDGVATIN